MTTVTEGLAAIRDMLHEPTPAAFTNSELKRYWNQANRDMARRTYCLDDMATVSVPTANVATFTLPANILRVNRCEWVPTNQTRRFSLTPRSYQTLDQLWGDNQTQQGDPSLFACRGTPPLLQLRLWPVPYTTGSLTLFVSRLPTDVVVNDLPNDTTVVDMPTGWDEIAYDYVCYRAFRRDKQYDTANLHLQNYEVKVADMIDNIDNYTSALDEMVPDQYGSIAWMFSPYQ